MRVDEECGWQTYKRLLAEAINERNLHILEWYIPEHQPPEKASFIGFAETSGRTWQETGVLDWTDLCFYVAALFLPSLWSISYVRPVLPGLKKEVQEFMSPKLIHLRPPHSLGMFPWGPLFQIVCAADVANRTISCSSLTCLESMLVG